MNDSSGRASRNGDDEPRTPAAELNYRVTLGGVTLHPAEQAHRQRRPKAEADRRPPEAAGPSDTQLVQFVGDLTAADVERLRREYRLALTAYVPPFTYVERVVPDGVAQRAGPARAGSRSLPARVQARPGSRGYQPEHPKEFDVDERRLAAAHFDQGAIKRVVEVLAAREVVVLDDRPIGGSAVLRSVVDAGTALDPLTVLDDVRFIEPPRRRRHRRQRRPPSAPSSKAAAQDTRSRRRAFTARGR
jgi:hypothetical protein